MNYLCLWFSYTWLVREKSESAPVWFLKARLDKLSQPTWSCKMKEVQSFFTAGKSFQSVHQAFLTCFHKTTMSPFTSTPPLVQIPKLDKTHSSAVYASRICLCVNPAYRSPSIQPFAFFPNTTQVWSFPVKPRGLSLYLSQRSQVTGLNFGNSTPIRCCCKEPQFRFGWVERPSTWMKLQIWDAL